jgi:hypothetical protein
MEFDDNFDFNQAEPEPQEQPQAEPKIKAKKSLLDGVEISKDAELAAALEDLKEPKQAYQETIKATEKEQKAPKIDADNLDGESQTDDFTKAMRMKNAQLIAKTGDVLVWGIGELAYNIPADRLKATEKEIKELATAWADFMEESGDIKMPPWVQLILVYGFVYGVKIYTAVQLQKKEKQLREEREASQQVDFEEDEQATANSQKPKVKPSDGLKVVKGPTCYLPGCNKLLKKPGNKFCSTSCRTKHSNWVKYGTPIKID